MNVDIKITISNYVAADTYKVNIYRQGSVIAVASKEIAANGGASVEFKGLAAGFTYEAEVIHTCSDGSVSTKKITVSAPNVKVCNCPAGFTANADKTKCVHVDTVPATYVAPAYIVVSGPKEGAYSREGLRVYMPGFTNDGKGLVEYASGNAHPYWASFNTTTKGRLNIAGVWNSADSEEPYNTWIGFSKKITIVETKVYWVAIAGDNYCRIKLNGTVLVDQNKSNVIANEHFNYWHCYPVLLNAGENFIEMECLNIGGIGCLAAEIYNCSIEDLKTVTPATEAILNRVFSTMDATQFNNNYSCQEGYALDISDPALPVCKRIEYAACS